MEEFILNNPPEMSLLLSTHDTSCYNSNDGKINITINNGFAPYTIYLNNDIVISSYYSNIFQIKDETRLFFNKIKALNNPTSRVRGGTQMSRMIRIYACLRFFIFFAFGLWLFILRRGCCSLRNASQTS